jgi:hypothetical protein
VNIGLGNVTEEAVMAYCARQLKAGMAEPEETATAGQWHTKLVVMAMDTYTTIELSM